MPKGGKQPGGGRPKGSKNKSTVARDAGRAWMEAQARTYTDEALAVLAAIMREGTSEPARIAAARELLDRGHGKAPQALTDADGGPLIPSKVIHEHIVG